MRIQHIIAFGDSFSDNGFSGGSGFNRLSNGPVWVEHLAGLLGVSLTDCAWCGGKSGMGNASGPDDWSGFAWQVDAFQPERSLEGVLFTVLIGINDVYDGKANAEEVVANTIAGLESLVAKGAKQLLVCNLPDISLAPAYINEYTPQKSAVHQLVNDVNARLGIALTGEQGFAARHPRVSLHFFDARTLFDAMVVEERFAVVSKPWNGTYSYPEEDGYMWWDDWHPTTATHFLFARAVFDTMIKSS